MVGYVNGRDWNESSGLFFCVFKFATRCESLNMFIEGRIGTRAGSEHYGQYDKKLYNMDLEEQGRNGWQDEIVDCVKPDLVSSWYLAQSF